MTGPRFPRLTCPISTAPMEARLVAELPDGPEWQFEPKWDGFRCLAFRDGGEVALMSKSGKPLERYFPEVVAMLGALRGDRFVVDGELILPVGGALSFDALQARLHPAASRIARLARETPAQLMLFDCLQRGPAALAAAPLAERRAELKRFVADEGRGGPGLSPFTRDRAEAGRWLDDSGGALDGIVAKRRDQPYQPGERAMLKLKVRRTADCVIGGYRLDAARTGVASLLLGLYDDDGVLHHVGFTSAIAATERPVLLDRLRRVAGPSPFTGRAPGGPSRWSGGKASEWCPVAPEIVVEVGYDQVTGERFRHGTALVRFRPDKAPGQCRLIQLERELRPAELAQIVGRSGAG
ncbi:MAG: ATP-dependent DNA ligase [Novosphingobium sp.]